MHAIRNQFLKRMAALVLCYYAVYPAVWWAFHRNAVHGLSAYFLAILPAIPILAMLVVAGMFLTVQKDEFKRFLVTQSLLWGVGAIFTVIILWGFLQLFLHIQPLNSLMLLPIFGGVALIAKFSIRRRYR